MEFSEQIAKKLFSEKLIDNIERELVTFYALSPHDYDSKLLHKVAIGFKCIVGEMEKASPKAFPMLVKWLKLYVNSKLFHGIAIRFKNIVHEMEKGSPSAFPLFIKWLKLYVRLQHQVDPKNKSLTRKFEKKIPVCTSYIVASLQYQTKIANYHLEVMEMCLSLLDSASTEIMKIIANMDLEIIALLWMPIEFVGHYNTQKISLKLIVKILKYLDDSGRRKKVTEIETSQNVRNLLLRLTADEGRFEKVSRELLNTFNMRTTKNCAVFSVYCTTALFNSFELFKPQACDRFWIDFNYTSKSVSFLCQIKHNGNDRKELSIEIKIDKLQIENQFDCIVISNNPAMFSTEVPTELKNAGIAVFTLPKTEFERLKANSDLLDFYNKSYNCSYSESDVAPSPNTIDNYLAGSPQIEDGFLGATLPEDNHVITPSIKRLQRPHVSNAATRNQSRPPMKDKTNQHTKYETAKPSKFMKARTSTKNTTAIDTSGRVLLMKESGYNSSISTAKQDSIIFKKPNKPVRLRTSQNIPPEKLTKSVQSSKSVQKKPQAPKKSATLLPQPVTESKDTSRRFFKSGGVQLSKIPNKVSRKKRLTNTGVSPTRKQVNTVKPLNHLTQADYDPEEAAVEFVENGGYANIKEYIESTAGSNRFSEPQRKQILENIEKINEDLKRSAQHFFSRSIDSDTDKEPIWPTTRKGALKGPEVRDFVPYTAWKKKQKQKTNGQSTLLCAKETNLFDQLKATPESNVSSQKPNGTEANATQAGAVDNASSSSSVSSYSNHNFHINESGNELDELSADEGTMMVDMLCRHQPEEIAVSPVPVPVSTRKDETNLSALKASLISDKLEMSKISQSEPECIIQDTAVPRRNSYQVSEIFEDPDDVPTLGDIKLVSHSAPEDEEENVEILSIHSSSASEQLTVRCSQPVPPIIPETTPCDEQNKNPLNHWYIERYLNDQQLYNQSSVTSNIPSNGPPSIQTENSLDPRLNSVTTNQVIIQNQFVVSTCRKRLLPVDNNESPLAKICSHGDKRIPLRGYARLLPSYMKKVTVEKDRLLKELEQKLHEDFFDNFSGIADDVMKSIADHETAINEAQEQLSFVYGKLEWLIENQQKNKAQLENIYCQLIGRIRAALPEQREVEQVYENAADKLRNYGTTTSSELWENFANGVVNSIEDRLKGLIHL